MAKDAELEDELSEEDMDEDSDFEDMPDEKMGKQRVRRRRRRRQGLPASTREEKLARPKSRSRMMKRTSDSSDFSSRMQL